MEGEVRMDPVTLVIIPGFLGGLIVALFMSRMRAPRPGVDPLRRHPLTTDVINMARIRVSGIGGFGLMMLAVAVALFVPRIRLHLLIGVALGILFAIALIALRRRSGPMPSSGGGAPGANTVLSLDTPETTQPQPQEPPATRIQPVTP